MQESFITCTALVCQSSTSSKLTWCLTYLSVPWTQNQYSLLLQATWFSNHMQILWVSHIECLLGM